MGEVPYLELYYGASMWISRLLTRSKWATYTSEEAGWKKVSVQGIRIIQVWDFISIFASEVKARKASSKGINNNLKKG